MIVTESVVVFLEEQLYDREDMESRTLRYPLDGSENLDLVCEWLKENNCKYEELQVQNETIGGKKG